MSMMTTEQPTNGVTETPFVQMLKTSSRKIVAIGASLRVWLRAVDHIVFSPEPIHQPDPEFINELVMVLTLGTAKPKNDKML